MDTCKRKCCAKARTGKEKVLLTFPSWPISLRGSQIAVDALDRSRLRSQL